MNSKLRLRISSIAFAFASSVAAAYPQLPPASSMPIPASGGILKGVSSKKVTVTAAASSAEQIRVAIRMEQKIYEAQSPQQKFDAISETMANLQIIPKAWPQDTAAIVRGAIMQADLAAEFGLTKNVIDALSPVVPLAQKTRSEPEVESKLGAAYEMAGNLTDAEKHLLAAERSLPSAQANRVEAERVLGSLAMFYSRRNQPREAIKRLRAQRDWPGQDVSIKMSSQLEILKQAVQLTDDSEHETARLELAAFDELLFRARATTISPAAATSVEHMAREAQRIKERHRL